MDRTTRYKYIHPMTNLSTDILDGIKSFCADMGTIPKRFISDCDCRLFSTDVISWLQENNSRINAAPEGKQNQNGLAEGTWRTILRMARGWIASSLLPPTYWWFAFKRAVEVSNYLPLKLNNKYTTPHELVYKEKPNLQNLLPMFSVCYIRRKTNPDNTKLKNVESHSIAVILVGRSTVSNSPVFSHPHTKKLLTTDDYYVDESIPAGPTFDIAHSGGLNFNSYTEANVYIKPPTYKPTQTVYVNIDETYHKATVITLPSRENNIYTVSLDYDGEIHQFDEKHMTDTDPYLQLQNDPSKNSFFPKWLQHNTPITIKLNDKYQHGTLLKLQDQFFFRSGRSEKNPTIHIPDFDTRAVYMIRNLLLFKGHPQYRKINELLQSRYIGIRSTPTLTMYLQRRNHPRSSTTISRPLRR